MRVGVTGATGFVGRRVVELLNARDATEVRIFTRGAGRARQMFPIPSGGISRVQVVEWDYGATAPPSGAFAGLDAVIHLAGENIAEKRWSAEQKRKIRDSRVLSTRHLVEGLKTGFGRPTTLVCASAIGYYGPRGDEEVTESEEPGGDFLADVCLDWESEARRAELLGMNVVTVRTGIVLGPGGGALTPLVRAFKLFAGGPVGNGRQWMSWIHLDDLARLYIHAVTTDPKFEALNGTSPNPVRNREFARTLGRVLGRPAVLPAPRIGLRIVLGEFADVLASGQRVLPAAPRASGFHFEHPELEPALRQILNASR